MAWIPASSRQAVNCYPDQVGNPDLILGSRLDPICAKLWSFNSFVGAIWITLKAPGRHPDQVGNPDLILSARRAPIWVVGANWVLSRGHWGGSQLGGSLWAVTQCNVMRLFSHGIKHALLSTSFKHLFPIRAMYICIYILLVYIYMYIYIYCRDLP